MAKQITPRSRAHGPARSSPDKAVTFRAVQHATEPSHAPEPVPVPDRLQTDLADVVDHAARLAAGSDSGPYAWFARLACAETATFKSLDVRQPIESAIRAHRPLWSGTAAYDLVVWPVRPSELPDRRLRRPASFETLALARTVPGDGAGLPRRWTDFFELCDDHPVRDLTSAAGISKELNALDELALPTPQKPPHFLRLERVLHAIQRLDGLSFAEQEDLVLRINGILKRFSASIAIVGTDKVATRLITDGRDTAYSIRLSVPHRGLAGFKSKDIEVVHSKPNRRPD